LTGAIKRADMVRNLAGLLAPERAAELEARVAQTRTDCDVLIIGGGPAGLTAGIYTGQAKLKTVVVDRALGGGNLAITHRVSNFPGFVEPQPGYQLAQAMTEQARAAGVIFRHAVDVNAVDFDRKCVTVDGIETICAKKMIVATGSSPRPLGVKGEQEFRGRGISYCATCDAKYFEGKHVVVIGGGNTAIGESLFIAKFAARITVVHQFDQLQANREFQQLAFANDKFEFLFSHEPREFLAAGGTVNGVEVEDVKTHQRKKIACDGVFVFAGMQPNLDDFAERFERDASGYIKVDTDMRTNVEDVYAAGDVRSTKYRQMTTAVSDGTVAAMVIAKELAN
jgi:thioredoxin reductase (NADPH)